MAEMPHRRSSVLQIRNCMKTQKITMTRNINSGFGFILKEGTVFDAEVEGTSVTAHVPAGPGRVQMVCIDTTHCRVEDKDDFLVDFN